MRKARDNEHAAFLADDPKEIGSVLKMRVWDFLSAFDRKLEKELDKIPNKSRF